MAIIDFFKKKKDKTEKKIKEKKAEKKEDLLLEKKEEKPKKIKEKVSEIAWRFLKSPHITEKAARLAEENQYTFKVWPKSNKVEIKKAIEQLYGVDVLSVKIINTRPKKRRIGRISGERPGYKKAIVKIKKGQKIELLPR